MKKAFLNGRCRLLLRAPRVKFFISRLHVMAEEVAERCITDESMYHRRPKTLVLHHRGVNSEYGKRKRLPSRTIQAPLPKMQKTRNKATRDLDEAAVQTSGTSDYEQNCLSASIFNLGKFNELMEALRNLIATTGKSLFRKLPNPLPCTRIGLCATDFVDNAKEPKSSFFKGARSSAGVREKTDKQQKQGKETHSKRSHTSSTNSNFFGKPRKPAGKPSESTDSGIASQRMNWKDVDRATFMELPDFIQRELENSLKSKSVSLLKCIHILEAVD